MGNNLSSQSERSFRIPKQSIVIEPEQKEEQKSSVNQIPAPKADEVSRDQILPIIMWMFSGSKPLRNFLLRLIPSKSTKTLLRTSNPFSGTTWNTNPQTYPLILKEPPCVRSAVCLTQSSLCSFGFGLPHNAPCQTSPGQLYHWLLFTSTVVRHSLVRNTLNIND